jgi:hypothetical protein
MAAMAADPAVRDGDLIFQTSRSAQSLAVQQATGSPYSHMGIVLLKDGRPCVFEAVATVRYTPLRAWIARGQDGKFVVKRLRKAPDPSTLARLHRIARGFEGRFYDSTFEWSDQRMYCSELVWKLYQRSAHLEIGSLQHLEDFRLDDPAVQAKLRERYGSKPPLDEPVISPVAMFDSPLLETVEEK